MTNFFTSPLEQFSVLGLAQFNIANLDLTLTNSSATMILTWLCVFAAWQVLSLKGGLLVPTRYEITAQSMVDFIASLTQEQLGSRAQRYETLIVCVFLYVLSANLVGLIPFSFATTAQIVVAFGLSFSLFFGVSLIGILRHGLHFLSFFMPSGAPVWLAPLLVVIEIISYVFRPISLGVRLFANITAGHSLLAIIAGFGWSIGISGGLLSLLCIIPGVVIVVIFGLELAVAFLQAYVFVVLLCIYLKDAIELH